MNISDIWAADDKYTSDGNWSDVVEDRSKVYG